MKVILKSTTNAQMLSEIGKKFLFYNKPIKNQPFACYGIDTKAVIFSSTVTFSGNVGNTLRVATANSEYIFEVVE
jgi:hypothetical protein